MLVLLTVLAFPAGRAEAQTAAGGLPGAGFLTDPFAFYYAIYLPNQQLQSMRPTPLDSVNAAMVSRQYYAQSSRRSLFDPVSPYAETHDPLRPYSNQQERIARPQRFQRAPSTSHGGPTLYFNRIAQYYPDMANRPGRQSNANLARRGGGARSGGAPMGIGGTGGMGGGGMGMPGMGMF
jgi:hypothetical protein